MLDFEKQFYDSNITSIVGIDEAGRGPLAGPVVAAAVILPKDYQNELINDSKKLSDKKRRLAYAYIKENALAIGVGIVSSDRIDEINIYEATKEAMHKALSNIKHKYELVIVDAMPLDNLYFRVLSLIKADEKVQCVAAASIIAKVTRDDIMLELDKNYPQYGFKNHKGYGSKLHIDAIKKYGPLKNIHRFSFAPIRNKNKK